MRFGQPQRFATAGMVGLMGLAILGCNENLATTSPDAPPDSVSTGTAVVLQALSPLSRTDDPTLAAWNSERLSNAAQKELRHIRTVLLEPETAPLPTVTVHHRSLQDAAPVYREGSLVVFRPPATAEQQEVTLSALIDTIPTSMRLATPFSLRVKFKLYRIAVEGDHFNTHVRWSFFGRTATGSAQRIDEWEISWKTPDSADGKPVMLAVNVTDTELVFFESRSEAMFGDATRAVTAALPDADEQFGVGVDRWASTISQFDFMTLLGHSGIAVGDVNGDGLDDVYISEEGGLPNRLWVQQADGTVRDLSQAAGVDWLDATFCSLLVDLDGDGDQDLAAATYPRLVLAENDGTGRFTIRQRLSLVEQAYSLSAADYDGDGDLDLYLASYGASGTGSAGAIAADGSTPGTTVPVPYHDANNGGANILLRNDGDFSFHDATRETGLDVHNQRFSFAAAWNDYDRDGHIDLYVANDFGRNSLYRNEGGQFVDVASGAGVEDIGTGMSVAWGDYNRDGQADLYVGNMFSGAGNRIARQTKFIEQHSREIADSLLRTARGNSLFANSGDGTFDDVSLDAGVERGLWAWSSRFADLNNDGWEDIVVCNGFITGDDTGDL